LLLLNHHPRAFGSNFTLTGSLFNHSDSPNVSYSIDTATESIRYTTVRAVEPDEELCIYFGSALWSQPVAIQIPDGRTCTEDNNTELVDDDDDDDDDGWGGLAAVAAGEVPLSSSASNRPPLEDRSDQNEILPDEDLPFARVKLTSDEDDEETLEAVRTGEQVPRFPARLLMPNTKYRHGPWTSPTPDT
jgi:tRNA-specific adenosine deaminase 3